MEYCSACEVPVETTITAIYRCIGPCKKLFHANCLQKKSPLMNNDVTLLENCFFICPKCVIIPEGLVSLSSNFHLQRHENRRLSTIDVYNNHTVVEDPVLQYIDAIDDAFYHLTERIPELSFLFKNMMTFVKIGVIF